MTTENLTEKELFAAYAEIARRDKKEFRAHYDAISKVAGFEVPESHVDALFISVGSEIWQAAYRVFSRMLFSMHAIQMGIAALVYNFQLEPKYYLLVPAVSLAYMGWAMLVGFLVRKGSEKLWDERTVAMKKFLIEVFDRNAKRLTEKYNARG